MALHRNGSTLKLIVSDAGKLCTSCCRFADSDCECFNGNLWDSVTEYIAGETVLHNDIYYNCLVDNQNTEPPNAVWFDISPYGGTDGTPQHVSITVQGVELETPETVHDPNGTHILTYTPFLPARLCRYIGTIPADPPFVDLFFRINMDISTVEIFILSPARAIFTGNPPGGDCLVFREFSNFMQVPGPGGWGGTAKQLPGAILPWDEDTFYELGDIVGHEGEFYRCKLAHTNQEPPNATFWVVWPVL